MSSENADSGTSEPPTPLESPESPPEVSNESENVENGIENSEEVKQTKENEPEAVLGIDLGSETAVLALLDLKTVKPDILRNDISNQKTPVIISFHDNQRSFGDAAKQLQTTNKDTTFTGLIRSIGKNKSEFEENTPYFTATKAAEDVGNHVAFKVNFKNEELKLRSEQLLAMFIAKLHSFAESSVGEDSKDRIVTSIVVPETFSESDIRSIFTACKIAGIDCREVITRTTACAVSNATRKSTEALNEKNIIYVDIGHGYASATVFSHNERNVTKIASRCDETLGSCEIGNAIYNELVKDVKERFKNYGEDAEIKPNSRGAIRLRTAAKKLKENLSGVTEANATCENLVAGQDVRFTFTRDRLENSCKNLRKKLLQMLEAVVTECKEQNQVIHVCELVGGGMRVPFVKECIKSALQMQRSDEGVLPEGATDELSFTLDSMASNCIGAGYHLIKKFEPKGAIRRPIFDTIASVTDSFGIFEQEAIVGLEQEYSLDEGELANAINLQIEMCNEDEKIRLRNEARNALEAFIFETRGAANGNRKYSELIKKDECLRIVNDAENWLHEVEAKALDDDSNENPLTVELFVEKLQSLKLDLEPSCGEYLKKVEEEEKKKEEELRELSKQAAEELEKSGGKDDHDFRKLSKPDRMKKVLMNKDEGTSLFKDGNFEPASLRYKRALQHCEKFFDLSEDDKEEVEGIKMSLHLNLAMCHIKLDNHDFALKSLETALEIDDSSIKALYRRAVVFEKKRDFDAAKKDLLKAQKLQPEDKAVKRLMQRVDIQIKKQKEKQKRMAQKMFG